MIYLLCGLGFVSVAFGISSGFFAVRENSHRRIVTKLVGSIFFVFTALLAAYHSKSENHYFILVITALIFGMLGDVFLCMSPLVAEKKSKKVFDALGFISFLIGHIFFISIFLSKASFSWYLLPLLLILPIAIFIADKIKFVHVGKMLIPCMIYTLFLGLMAVSAINIFIAEKSTASILALIAGLLFTTSDSSLCIRDFGKFEGRKRKILVYIVLSTYYIAQVLFALTIYYV